MQRKVTSGIQLAALGNPLIDLYASVSQEAIKAAGIKPGSAVHGEVGRDSLLSLLDQQFIGPGGSIAVDYQDAGSRSGFLISSTNPLPGAGGGCSSGSCGSGGCGC